MINFKFVRFTLVVYVSHKVDLLVTDIILNITSQEHMIFAPLHIGSRLLKFLSKRVRVKKQPRMPLSLTIRGGKDVQLLYTLKVYLILSHQGYISVTIYISIHASKFYVIRHVNFTSISSQLASLNLHRLHIPCPFRFAFRVINSDLFSSHVC